MSIRIRSLLPFLIVALIVALLASLAFGTVVKAPKVSATSASIPDPITSVAPASLRLSGAGTAPFTITVSVPAGTDGLAQLKVTTTEGYLWQATLPISTSEPPSTGVVVTAWLPANAIFVSGETVLPNGSKVPVAAPTGDSITAPIGPLTAGQSATVTIIVSRKAGT